MGPVSNVVTVGYYLRQGWQVGGIGYNVPHIGRDVFDQVMRLVRDIVGVRHYRNYAWLPKTRFEPIPRQIVWVPDARFNRAYARMCSALIPLMSIPNNVNMSYFHTEAFRDVEVLTLVRSRAPVFSVFGVFSVFASASPRICRFKP